MELLGHYYDIGYNQLEQYNKTTKAICEHAGITYRNGAGTRVSTEGLQQLVIPINDLLAGAT